VEKLEKIEFYTLIKPKFLQIMKTIKLLFFAMTVLTAGFISSCTETTDPVGPTIEFIAGDGLIVGDDALETGANISFKALLTEGDAKLESYTIRHADVDVDGYPKTDISTGDNDVFSTIAEVGSQVYTCILTDKDGLTDTRTITVTVTDPIVTPTITVYTNKILGANSNTTIGSSFASIDGTIYNLADAKTNSNKVDFFYYYGATNKATLSAPSDVQAVDIFSSISTWGTKNATIFEASTMTAAEFDLVDAASAITAPTGTGTKVAELAVGDVVAFQTAATSANPSKKGLIKVVAFETVNTGTMTVVVKVQK
jgi:hypothetical protein